MAKKHEELKQTVVAAVSKKLQRKLEMAQAEQKDAAQAGATLQRVSADHRSMTLAEADHRRLIGDGQ